MYEVWGLFGRYQHSSCFRSVTDRAPVRVKYFNKKTMHEVFGSRKILDRKCVYFLISLIKSISPNDDDEICCSYGTLVTSFCLTISFWTFHSESRWKLWSISGNKCSNSLRIPRLWHQKVLPQDFVWEEEKKATGKVSNINRFSETVKNSCILKNACSLQSCLSPVADLFDRFFL